MGKKYTTILTLFATICFILSGCEQDDEQISNRGKLNLRLAADTSVESTITRATTDEGTKPDINNFTIAVLQNNSIKLSWDKYADFTDGTEIPAGNYTLKAAYGNIETQGFDAPYYEGIEDFSIKKSESTDVSVTCRLANVKITTEYTETFKKYFTDYSVKIRPAGGSDITFSKSETRAAYVKPGKVSIYMTGSKQQGNKVTFEPSPIEDAKARTHYRIKFDVNAGGTELNISFSEETEREPIVINISDEALNTYPPFFTPTGFESGVAQELIEWTEPKSQLSTLLTARGGIAKCILITRSPSLIKKGWPDEIDLANPDPSVLATMQGLGLATKGLSANIDKMAILDFTKVLVNMAYSEANSESTFTLIATDKLNKVSEVPLVLKIKSLSNDFDVAQPMNVMRGSTSIQLTITLKGDISKVRYQYQAYGYWQSLTPAKVESDVEKHQIFLPFEEIQDPQQIKIIAGDKENIVTVGIGESSCSLSSPEGSVWAKKATIYLVGDTEGTTEYLKTVNDITLEYKKESGAWSSPTQKKVKEAIEVTGLEPNTNYTFKAIIKGTNTIKVLNEISVKTEEELQIPNSDFEEWSESKVWEKSSAIGGQVIYAYHPYKSTDTDRWWSTYNDKTTQELADASWYYGAYPGSVPTNAANMHTASWHLNTYKGMSLNTGAFDGNVSVELSTVGWGKNNWGPGTDTGVNYADQRTAGRLFIGTYDRKAQTETLGHSFESRPAAVHFYYTFYSYNGESAKAYVVLEDENRTVIGKGELIISTTTNNYLPGTININYTEAKKAKYITIMFLSSASDSPSTLAVVGNSGMFSGYGDSRHIGNILTIDNVSLEY